MIDLEKDLLRIINENISNSVGQLLTKYDSPFVKIVNNVIEQNETKIHKIVSDAFGKVISTQEFKNAMHEEFQHKVARVLVSKLEGSVEKAVNDIRNDPTLKAKMILAIENIIKENDRNK